MVKELPRPLTVLFEESRSACDVSQGSCLFRKSSGTSPPGTYGTWRKMYFVVGGAVAKPHVLQIYESKTQYEAVVVKMFQNEKPGGIKFKAYSLSKSFKLGPIREKRYRMAGVTIKYFWIKNPRSRTKTMKIAAENASIVQALHSQLRKFAPS
jgi:hypothetical protein